MAGVTAQLAFSLVARLTAAAVGGSTPQFPVDIERSLAYAPGTGAIDQANILYHATRTLAASGTEDLDLAGVLANALGATIAAAEIVCIVIQAAAGNTNTISWGPTASVGALLAFGDLTDRLQVRPGDFQVLSCVGGWTITATTADKITVTNLAGSTGVDYTITLIGRTVAA